MKISLKQASVLETIFKKFHCGRQNVGDHKSPEQGGEEHADRLGRLARHFQDIPEIIRHMQEDIADHYRGDRICRDHTILSPLSVHQNTLRVRSFLFRALLRFCCPFTCFGGAVCFHFSGNPVRSFAVQRTAGGSSICRIAPPGGRACTGRRCSSVGIRYSRNPGRAVIVISSGSLP